jgi:AraC-like DNA-binding protein
MKEAGMAEVFETTDMDLAEQVLSRSYGKLRIEPKGQQHSLRMTQAALGPVRLDQFSCTMSFRAIGAPVGVLVIPEFVSGRARYYSGGNEGDYRSGDVCLTALADNGYTAAIEDVEVNIAVIDPVLLSQVADAEPGRTRQPVRFTGRDPVSGQAEQIWKDTCAYIRDSVLPNPEAASQPLIAAAAARMLVAAALATFPNNAFTEPTIEDRHDAHPDTLRRAITFIDENAHRDITIADIAAAAFVTIRAIQLVFRRHLDTTPTEYLRRVRLDHARQDLMGADPARDSVAAIAYRWGFPNPSRFAAQYRQTYGVRPSHTLHRG